MDDFKMSASMPENQQVIYSRSIKIEDTAKGIRLSVHVYSNTTNEAIEQAFTMHLKAKVTAMDNKIQLAPVASNSTVTTMLYLFELEP